MSRVLLIPGLLCDEFVWQPVQTALRRQSRIADLSSQDSLTIMAEDCLARFDGPLVVAGHSMGARVALEMARLAPARIERLALLDTGIHPCGRVRLKKDARLSSWPMIRGCRRWLRSGCPAWSMSQTSKTSS